MLPIDIAKTAILKTLATQGLQDEAALLKAVNDYAPNSPTVAMQPALRALVADRHLQPVDQSRREGFFYIRHTCYQLTACGEDLAAQVMGLDPAALKLDTAFALLGAAQSDGRVSREARPLMQAGPHTTRKVFDQLVADGALRAEATTEGFFRKTYGHLTAKGEQQLRRRPAPQAA